MHMVDVATYQLSVFWADRLQLAALLCPSTPTGIFKANTISNLVLLLGHSLPTAPHILVSPLMTEVVDADCRHPRLDLCVIGSRALLATVG